MADDPNKIIFERRHPDIKSRLDAYDLITDSFYGGLRYISKSYLFKYSKETPKVYDGRRERSVFLNHMAPVVETLVGLLFDKKPVREVPADLGEIIKHANNRQSFEEFFQEAATKSLLNTCGILVDSPSFDPNKIRTLADQRTAGLRPYLVLYEFNQIRDFSVDETGELLWILLDNTYEKDSDPFSERKKMEEYRLWTREYFQDFQKIETGKIASSEKFPHAIGRIPFIFISWSDKTKTLINQTVFEDIAVIDRKIYNYLSVADEVIYSGSFPLFIYPGNMPETVAENGIASQDWLTFDPNSSNKPDFIIPGIDALDGILAFIEKLGKKILQKVGLDREEERTGAQSGKAKLLEYKVANAFLLSGATRLEKAEFECLELCRLWMNSKFETKTAEIVITYQKKFETVDIDKAITTLLEIFTDLKYAAVKKRVAKEIVNKALPEIDEKEKKQLFEEIDSADENEIPGFVKKYIEDPSNNSAASSDNGAKQNNGSPTDKGTKSKPGGDPDINANG
ncbi:YlbF family regulator [Leptospira santarosai]|uniref:YlbF family regulator n=1 Tax=Leptospira santarosai TaxID=28183 RepID=UPI0038B3B4FC